MPLILLYNPILFSYLGPVSCSETADTGTKEDSMKNVTDETRDLRQKIKNINIRDQLLGGHPHARSPIFKHTIVQQETVKRVVQQNCRSSAVPGFTYFNCEILLGLFLVSFS